ncbi:MAG: phospholipase D family protein [Gammaproteobacteria bacterium]|jgi:putative cardiolipin synthase|nr:phospholipase D family protein [Gammaproteobacteria bacterium]
MESMTTQQAAHSASRGLALLMTLLAVAACTALEPLQSPVEVAPEPAQSAAWQALEEAAPAADWHVLLNEGSRALDWRLRAIDSATASIDLQTFLWNFDTVGSLTLDHLLRAADRGVAIRLLIDDTFLVQEDEVLLALTAHPNIRYRVFNPYKRRSTGMVTRTLLNLGEFSRLDHRMHNKAMVVDDQVAIVGGRNLADEYFGLNEQANFRDLEMLLGGRAVQEVSDAFNQYWNSPWSIPIESVSHKRASAEQLAAARTVASGAAAAVHREESAAERLTHWRAVVAGADTGTTRLYFDNPPDANPADASEAPVQVTDELIALFEGAREEVVIVSAYLIPTPELEGAVANAIARGVRIRVLTNSIQSNNHLTAHSAYRNHINTLLDSGADVHEVRINARDRARYMLTPLGRKTLALHAKALIIDRDKVFIGSANLDPRSLRINTEMGFLVTSEAFNSVVRAAVEADFDRANAWQLEKQPDGAIYWVGDDEVLTAQPAASFMQRIEDWFFAHLPLENKL